MNFWKLSHSGPALRLPSVSVSYDELASYADAFGTHLPPATPDGDLGFILGGNDLPTVAAYLGSLRGKRCQALLPKTMPGEFLSTLIEQYQPEWIYAPGSINISGYAPGNLDAHASRIWQPPTRPARMPVHRDTALLLSTSGSTGSPKMVRLSRHNLQANAESIAQYLSLDQDERAITTLPLSYSYGLSVINSHLHAGSSIILSDDSILSRSFWDAFRRHAATSLAGVPYTYQMLQRLRIDRMGLSSLRTLTQAGGHLNESVKREFLSISERSGWRFFVMYGQTEATARIAYVPPERLAEKINSIGLAIPAGSLSLDPSGELVYRGPNVMMGYASTRVDLEKGNELGGILHTGDLAEQDRDGYFSITGRIKRITKVFGNRINLDEVELMLERKLGEETAALDGMDRILIVTENADADRIRILTSELLGLHPSGISVITSRPIPHLESGKKDYTRLYAGLDEPR